MKNLRLLLLMALLPVMFSSCVVADDEPYYPPFLAGQTYTAEGAYGSGVYWWMISFNDYGNYDYDGQFFINSYDSYGNRLPISETGWYYIDYQSQTIHLYYDNYYGDYEVWEFDRSPYQGWPYYRPNYDLYVPRNNGGPLAGLVFYAGNWFQAPPSFWD